VSTIAFTVLNPMIIIANQYGGRTGLPVVYGALLAAGVFGSLIAKPFSMVLRFFPRWSPARSSPSSACRSSAPTSA